MRGKAQNSRLTAIDADALEAAVHEFNCIGRQKFLRKYGFSRSSKFYLLHEERIYDTKVLVGAAYLHATGRRLTNKDFAGGNQTKAVLNRICSSTRHFRKSEVFEDKYGELSNITGEFDRLPSGEMQLHDLGFSKWISLENYNTLHTKNLPGVYVIADCRSAPERMTILDNAVVYVGETVSQTLHKRLYQFHCSINSRPGHSGGRTLRKKHFPRHKLWVAIRSFPLAYGPEATAHALRSSQIRWLERTLLHDYVRANDTYPPGNSK